MAMSANDALGTASPSGNIDTEFHDPGAQTFFLSQSLLAWSGRLDIGAHSNTVTAVAPVDSIWQLPSLTFHVNDSAIDATSRRLDVDWNTSDLAAVNLYSDLLSGIAVDRERAINTGTILAMSKAIKWLEPSAWTSGSIVKTLTFRRRRRRRRAVHLGADNDRSRSGSCPPARALVAAITRRPGVAHMMGNTFV